MDPDRRKMVELTRDTLELIGFVDVAGWHLDGKTIAYALDGAQAKVNELRLDTPNALYAFVRDDQVQYIGKTSRSARKRFVGYRNPHPGQRTNHRCNARIKEALGAGGTIRILVFTPISDLRYRDFEINLAADLEDALIEAFRPPWNWSELGKPLTEEAEREEAEEKVTEPVEEDRPGTPESRVQDPIDFTIKLGTAYYGQGIINPGSAASQHLGADGEPIQISFDDGTEPIMSSINRTANANGTVRVVGRNRAIAEWFQRHFKPGEVVRARVLDRNRIRLTASSQLT